jgi:hypothetical protein
MYTAFAAAAFAHYLTGATWRALPLTGLAIAWLAPVMSQWLDPEPTGEDEPENDLPTTEIVDDTPGKD